MVVDVYGIGTLDPGAVPGWSTISISANPERWSFKSY
ncbi:hypothetical protein UFOVP1071_28 [uncultured Caudovirales phage]|uniref:Uncharacterized protein n=1 Tax=uncultured Caudovirales phage TaxID=2100421 RepID=A0A6J5QK57_9CAUD|nr:hypothetical protein UFOVP1071_28 [uncultured Caudovirales phage]